MATKPTPNIPVFIPPVIDIAQVKKLYQELSELVYTDMDKQYKEGKISGPTYSETWKELMKATITGSLNSVVSLMNKETAMDRCVKESTCAKNKKEMELIDEKKKESIESVKMVKEKTTAEKIKNGEVDKPKSLYHQNILVLKAQDALYQRQKVGFDDNARQKVMDSALSTYSILFQDLNAKASDLPDFLHKAAAMQSSYDSVAKKIGKPGPLK